MNETDPFVFLNGRFLRRSEASLSVEDRGAMFADGVYEVVMYCGGRPVAMDKHLLRLGRSMAAIHLPVIDAADTLDSISDELVRRNGCEYAKVYWQVTRGVAERNHLIDPALTPTVLAMAYPMPPLDTKACAPKASAILTPDERWANCWIKSLMLLPNALAMTKARDAGADEAIMVRDGVVTEGSATNVLIVRDGELWTHPADRHILGGITRDIVLGLACRMKIVCHEEPFGTDDLMAAPEVMICGTTMCLTAVCSVDGTQIGDGQVGPVTARLHRGMMDHVARACNLT